MHRPLVKYAIEDTHVSHSTTYPEPRNHISLKDVSNLNANTPFDSVLSFFNKKYIQRFKDLNHNPICESHLDN